MKLNFLLQLPKLCGVATFCSILFLSNLAQASGLMVTPNRVEFSNDAASEEVKLVNRGNETMTYRVSFQNLRMKQDGTYEEISAANKGDEKFADNFIKFSPKRVTLKPGETQVVRLKAKFPAEKGEYRSHLLLSEEVPAEFGNEIEGKKPSGKNVAVVLKPVFAVSIPVILRSGDLVSRLSVEKMSVINDKKEKEKKTLLVHLKREGDASSYGKVVVSLTPKGSSQKQEIASISNVSVYYPYEGRDLSIPLDVAKKTRISGATVDVKFVAANNTDKDADENAKEKVLAQKSVVID